MGQVRAALSTFFAGHGAKARFGLTIFPADNVCAPAGADQQRVHLTPASESPADLQAWANGVNAEVQMTTPGGGTPTAQSLAYLRTVSELTDPAHAAWVIVITDGLPNCDPANPNVCTNATACKCTLSGGQCGTVVNDTDPNNFCRRGCLDEDSATQAVTDLRARGIRTVVIGIGTDFKLSTDAVQVLMAMSSPGGYVRQCPTGNECNAGDTCSPGHSCGQSFYGAQNASELAAALTDIANTIAP
jgi:hypothetical protein